MADYYGNNDWRDYLAHYGVKGMKWRHHKKKDLNSALGEAVSKISDSAESKRRNVLFKYRKGAVRRRISGLKNLSGNLANLRTSSESRSKKVNKRRVGSLALKTSNASEVTLPLIRGKRKKRSREAIVKENLLKGLSESQTNNGTRISIVKKKRKR